MQMETENSPALPTRVLSKGGKNGSMGAAAGPAPLRQLSHHALRGVEEGQVESSLFCSNSEVTPWVALRGLQLPPPRGGVERVGREVTACSRLSLALLPLVRMEFRDENEVPVRSFCRWLKRSFGKLLAIYCIRKQNH